MKRETIGRVAFGILVGLYCLDVLLPVIGATWFSRSGGQLFWSAFLFFYLPMITSITGMALIYGKQKLSWWLTPILIYATIPLAFVTTLFLRSGTLVTVQEAARNTQGFGAAALISAVVLFTTIAFPLFIGGPIVLATCVWAEKEWKKLVAIPVISFVVLTAVFFILLT